MTVWGLLVTIASAEPTPALPETAPAAGREAEANQERAPREAPATPQEAAAPSSSSSEAVRLLGPATPGASPEAVPIPVIDTFSWWPFLLVGVGAGALWWARRHMQATRAEAGSELRVVGRADLGPQSGLAVVEVRDRSGTWRRLVLGTGDGPPQLVADLGEPQFGLLGADEESTVEEVELSRPAARPDLPRDFEAYDPLPSPSEAGLPPLPADPHGGGSVSRSPSGEGASGSGRALVHEVLGERRRRSRRTSGFQTFA